MSSLLAGACAAAALLALVHRPAPPARLRRHEDRRPVPTPTALAERVGRSCRGALGRRADHRLDRRAGAVLGLATVAAVVGPGPAVAGGAALALRAWWRRVRAGSPVDLSLVERDVPDLVDLLSLAVGAGLSVPAALAVVAPLAPPSLRDDLGDAVAAIAGGRPCDEAVTGLGQRWGAPARPLVHALADHLRYGTAILPALERVGSEARTRRRRAAETRARKLPVLLLFPLVLCVLPAFGLLTVAPLVAGTFDSLRGGPLEAPASLGP